MAVSGVVDAVDRDEVANDGTRSWRVTITPDAPTALAGGDGKRLLSLAFQIARPADPSPTVWAAPPIGAGDRLTLPLLHAGKVVPVTRADGSSTSVRMIGWAFDPAG